MEQIDKIKKLINEQNLESDLLYLVESLSEDSGLFIQNSQVIFAKHSYSNESIIIETNHLKLIQYVSIDSNKITSTFTSGYYDLIIYKGNIIDTNTQAFINLCSSFAKLDSISFYEFFHSLVKLFKTSNTEDKNNYIGLWGELYVIYYFWTKYSVNLADYWHLSGTSSKFDLVINENLIEIKTSSGSDNIFKIKHDQLFSNRSSFIIVLNAIKGSKWSINDFSSYFDSIEPFKSNFNFKYNRIKELMKIDDKSLLQLKLNCEKLLIFNTSNLDSITNIPDCISNLSYDYYFDSKKSLIITEFIRQIKERE